MFVAKLSKALPPVPFPEGERLLDNLSAKLELPEALGNVSGEKSNSCDLAAGDKFNVDGCDDDGTAETAIRLAPPAKGERSHHPQPRCQAC